MASSEDPDADEVQLPSGYKPGDTPEGLAWPQRIWIVLPPNPSAAQNQTYRQVLKKAEELGIGLNPIKAVKRKGLTGLEFTLLTELDAASLYRGLHRHRVAVIALTGCKVLLDISEAPSNKGCVSLEDFVRYKCFYRLVSRPEILEGTFREMTAWLEGESCHGHRDPRCIPMQIFVEREKVDLDSQEGRDRFDELHRGAGARRDRVDGHARIWEVGPHHTKDLIQVAGRCLPIGFHWDVQLPRSEIIVNGWERWEIPRGYANVHPDATIRANRGTRTHGPKRRASNVGTRAKTPRSVRKSRGARK